MHGWIFQLKDIIMSIQQDTQLEGTLGEVIFYKSKGKYLSRRKGNTGKQAPEAKVQATILGKAAAVSAILRKTFAPLLPEPRSRKLMYRLNNILQQWLRSQPRDIHFPIDHLALLEGFTFNESNPLGAVFYTTMPVTRLNQSEISIKIPAFDSPNPIAPLPFTGEINIEIMAVSFSLNNTDDLAITREQRNLQYDGTPIPEQHISMLVNTGDQKLTVVALSVNKMAAGIVGAMWN